MNVSIVIITHNTKSLLDTCLQSIQRQNCILELEIIVVDNGSSDDTLFFVKKKYPKVIIIRNEISKGFSHGVNTGIKQAKGRNIFVLEADTELISEGIIEKLSSFLDSNDNIAAVVPQLILYKSKSIQRSAFICYPNLITFFMEWSLLNIVFGAIFPYLNYPGKYYYTRKQLAKTRRVAWAMGGILMLKRHVFDKVGGMDEKYFLLSEDKDLLKKFKNINYQVWYLAEVQVLHHWGVNQDNIEEGANQYYNSMMYYLKKHQQTNTQLLYPIIIITASIILIPISIIFFTFGISGRVDLKNLLVYRYYILKKCLSKQLTNTN